MYIFADPEMASRAGFKIVDYDLEHQSYIVEKDYQRLAIRARSNAYAAIVQPGES